MYKKLKINFKIPEDLEDIINEYIECLNNDPKPSHDYYQTEIMLILNWCKREGLLEPDQIKMLREYYEHGGILKGV